jgi:hypothetical protein
VTRDLGRLPFEATAFRRRVTGQEEGCESQQRDDHGAHQDKKKFSG